MNRYCFIDGPLGGQAIGLSNADIEQRSIDIEVVDIGDRPEVPVHFTYEVVRSRDESRTGGLRHVPWDDQPPLPADLSNRLDAGRSRQR